MFTCPLLLFSAVRLLRLAVVCPRLSSETNGRPYPGHRLLYGHLVVHSRYRRLPVDPLELVVGREAVPVVGLADRQTQSQLQGEGGRAAARELRRGEVIAPEEEIHARAETVVGADAGADGGEILRREVGTDIPLGIAGLEAHPARQEPAEVRVELRARELVRRRAARRRVVIDLGDLEITRELVPVQFGDSAQTAAIVRQCGSEFPVVPEDALDADVDELRRGGCREGAECDRDEGALHLPAGIGVTVSRTWRRSAMFCVAMSAFRRISCSSSSLL